MILVLGLGNPVRGDDGAGLAVAREVERLLAGGPIEGVVVRTSARGGFDLVDLLAGCEQAVIIDALEVPSAEPGRVRALSVEQVAGSSRLVGGHDISLAAALELGRTLGIPMPSAIDIYGIDAGETAVLCETLTPAVAAAVQPLARLIYDSLQKAEGGGR